MSDTQQFVLKAMAKNYADGHSWDHLDGEVCTKAADEISRLTAEVSALRKALEEKVRGAYNEGFSEGMKEHNSSRGGKPWRESKACAALAPASGGEQKGEQG